jgi:hypothetical protein
MDARLGQPGVPRGEPVARGGRERPGRRLLAVGGECRLARPESLPIRADHPAGRLPHPSNQARWTSFTSVTRTSRNAIPAISSQTGTAGRSKQGGPSTGNRGGPMPVATTLSGWSHSPGRRQAANRYCTATDPGLLGLSCWALLVALNGHVEPPADPVEPERAWGVWTWSNVRDVRTRHAQEDQSSVGRPARIEWSESGTSRIPAHTLSRALVMATYICRRSN